MKITTLSEAVKYSDGYDLIDGYFGYISDVYGDPKDDVIVGDYRHGWFYYDGRNYRIGIEADYDSCVIVLTDLQKNPIRDKVLDFGFDLKKYAMATKKFCDAVFKAHDPKPEQAREVSAQYRAKA